MEIIEAKPGDKLLLLGNEAIARGALEAGVDFVTTYPGTPSSEIADTFSAIAKYLRKKGKEVPFYFEYSVNEKVALEIAAAASFCKLRALTCMKHVGLNVASDALMTYAYVGCRGGHIIVSADDPHCHSSQNEQDNRYYAIFANIPMLEPSNAQEAKEMAKEGMEISEEIGLPLLLRTTTRISHTRGVVEVGELGKPRRKGHFEKDPMMVTVPITARARHPVLIEKMERAEKLSEKSRFNEIIENGGGFGIVASGVSVAHSLEAIDMLGIEADILKIGFTNPLPKKLCEKFLEEHDKVLVVEELEPLLEHRLKQIAFDAGLKVEIYGKDSKHFTRLYEYTPDKVADAISKLLNLDFSPSENKPSIDLPQRPPVMCPGCPHRASYYAVKQVAPKDVIYPTDIGCYTLGKYPPLEIADVLLCMGSNAGTACGFSKATDQKIISFMGDSTFFHAGIPAVIDAVHHNHDCVITILDNRTTAMTGHQPHPGVAEGGMGEEVKAVSVEEVVKGLGVKDVHVVDPRDLEKTKEAFRKALNYKGPSVVVCKAPCVLLDLREKRRKGEKIKKYQVNQNKCKKCKVCVLKFGCPAIFFDGEKVMINEEMCTGCGVCAQVCPFNAIEVKE